VRDSGSVREPQLALRSVWVVVYVTRDPCPERTRPCDGGVEVVDLEPQEHSIAERLVRVAHGTVVVGHVPGVKLKDEAVGAPLGVV